MDLDVEEQVTNSHLLLEDRTCRVCGKEKHLLTDFYLSRKDSTLPSSYSYECKACTIKRTSDYNKKNSSSVRSQYLKRNYGLSFEEFDTMLTEQGNACAICGTSQPSKKGGRHRRFQVDHNPTTRAVRGLLCNSCHIIVKEVGDNLQTLESMIEYLSKK